MPNSCAAQGIAKSGGSARGLDGINRDYACVWGGRCSKVLSKVEPTINMMTAQRRVDWFTVVSMGSMYTHWLLSVVY